MLVSLRACERRVALVKTLLCAGGRWRAKAAPDMFSSYRQVVHGQASIDVDVELVDPAPAAQVKHEPVVKGMVVNLIMNSKSFCGQPVTHMLEFALRSSHDR